MLPSLAHEQRLWAAGARRVAGVDEVGLGPLCAAVVAAAVVLPPEVDPALLAGVRDSKAVPTSAAREQLAARVRRVAAQVGVGAASPREVDRLNVRGAAALAMQRALKRIAPCDHALVDGRPLRGLVPAPGCRGHTYLVKGDARCLSIACASLVAKVTRDHLLRLLAARYPQYGWERNRGYPTPDHLAALRAHGPTPHHRRRYRPVLQAPLDLALEPETTG